VSADAGGFTRLSEREVFRGHVIQVTVGTFRGPDGSTFERDVVHHPGAVAVVPLLDDGHVALVRQFRAPINRLLLEIPAGIRDVTDEPTELTARRELAEEVGLEASTFELLCEIDNAAGFCDERYSIYLARGLTAVENSLQGIEEQHMSVEHIALDDVPELIVSGELTDAKSVIGLTLTMRRLGR
jgi:8-oxo-dGTP pyrophosphatase MutT (NUDIX family)